MSKTPYFELIANKLIEQLKAGTAPFQKPWKAGEMMLPHNPVSGTRYRGANVLWLMMQGYSDPRWMTYKQAQSIGAQVRKGEKSTFVQYWKFYEEKTVKDDQGNTVKQRVVLDRPRAFSARVFNAEQIDGLPALDNPEVTWSMLERAEQILARSGAIIKHDQADRAFYRVSTDSIHLPPRAQFAEAAGYYAVALHELGHWTGHPERLDRDLSGGFGSGQYAKEELRAEIASMMIGETLGIGYDPGQHAAYVQSWIQVLQDDPKEILRAARDAEKIRGYILDLGEASQQAA